MKKLKITIDPKGEVSFQVEGVGGPSCLGETKFLEDALGGEVKAHELTSDYYAPAVAAEGEVKAGG